MFGIGGHPAIAGLDLGSSSVKAVQLARTHKGYQVACAGFSPLAHDAIVDGAINDGAEVVKTIAAVFSENFSAKFSEKKLLSMPVAASLSGPSVIVKRLGIQVTADGQLEQQIQDEVARSIPFEPGNVSLSYQVLMENDAEMDVLLVAAQNEMMQSHVKVLKAAGKVPQIMDVDLLALQNCFEANYEIPAADIVALVNIGASMMNINIVQDGKPLFARDVPVGGLQFTEALAKELHVGFDQADEVKINGQLPHKADGTAIGASVEAILRPTSESLILEIKKTFEYFQATSQASENISTIYVSGGTSKLTGLLDTLRMEIGLPVDALNPFRRIEMPHGLANEAALRGHAPEMAVAVGLALRGVEG